MYETLGEDPFLASQMARNVICGQQGCPRTLADPTKVAACMKHYIGYPNPRSGHDRTPAWLPFRHLLNYYAPAFQAAIDADVATAMESYSEVDGVPMASSNFYLQQLLREQMGFTNGFMVTDYAEIENQYTWHHVADSQEDAVFRSISRTSIDMSMIPLDTSFPQYLLQLVQEGSIPEARIDESVARILAIKEELGLLDTWRNGKRMETPEQRAVRASITDSVGSVADREAALAVARQAVVLLQNNNATLPLTSRQRKHGATLNVLLTGPSADSISYQTGGWSIHWQGAADSEFVYGTTLLDALTSMTLPDGTDIAVKYEPAVDVLGNINTTSLNAFGSLGKMWADVVIYVGGEAAYAERPGNIDDLTLPAGQQQVITLAGSFGVPSVLVLFEGRPRLLNGAQSAVSAVVHGLLTGPDAGQAVAEILVGTTAPSGRLPFSYPADSGNALVHYWHAYPEADYYTPAWAFGTGLSYTTWSYSNLTLNVSSISVEQLQQAPVGVTISVTNTGSMPSQLSVLMYVSDVYRSVTPEVKMLKGFERVCIGPGGSVDVSFTLDTQALSFWNEQEPPVHVIETGEFVVSFQDSALTASFNVTS